MLRPTLTGLLSILTFGFFLLQPPEVQAAGSKKVQRLIHWLQKGNDKQKTQAARKLSKMGRKAGPATPFLSVMLLKGPKSARPYVIRALLGAGDISIGALMPLYRNYGRGSKLAKKTATKILRRMGQKVSPLTVVALMKMFTVKNSRNHDALSTTLGSLGPRTIPVLEKHIAVQWSTPLVQGGVAKAAMQMGPKGHAFLRRLLKHKDKYVRKQTAEACQEEGSACAPVVKALAGRKHDTDKWTRWYAIWAISKQKPAVIATVEKSLLVFVRDPWRNVRVKARKAYGKLGKRGIANLRPMLKGDLKSKLTALKVLGWMKGKSEPLTDDLLKLLSDSNIQIRTRSLQVLQYIGPKARRALKNVARLLKRDTSVSARFQALKTFGVLGNGSKQQCRVIRPFLTHPELLLRMRAVQLLGRWKDKGSTAAFVRAIDDKHEYVRREAIKAVQALRIKSAIRALTSRTTDKDMLVKVYAIKALGSFGKDARSALWTLKKHLKDRSYYSIRRHLRKAIAQIEK
jgi:HEAT repeat protein